MPPDGPVRPEGPARPEGPVGPAWLDELPLGADGPPWLSMGLAKLDLDRWLLPDEHRAAELAERGRLLRERHDEVFAALPGTEDAGAETLALVRAWLADHGIADPPEVGPPGQHPLERAGRLAQEDLCLMVPRHGAHHLDAACLCFPTGWRLGDKLGRPTAVIHEPVPHYAEDLRARVDRYLERLRPEVPVWRRNWGIHDEAHLFAPWSPEGHRPVVADEVGERLWLRSERQTLRRLPETGAVLFTILVQQTRLAALAGRPGVAAALAARLRAQPHDLTASRGVGARLPAVLAWLDAIC